MAMWKPDMSEPGTTREIAELKWAYVLGHEFVHAFTYRYKTSRMPPLWINEGLRTTSAASLNRSAGGPSFPKTWPVILP